MKHYQAVLYDIDGTLLNTVNMNMYPLLRIIKEERGEEWDLADVVKFMAYPGMKVMEELGIHDPETTYQRWVRYVNEYEGGGHPLCGGGGDAGHSPGPGGAPGRGVLQKEGPIPH